MDFGAIMNMAGSLGNMICKTSASSDNSQVMKDYNGNGIVGDEGDIAIGQALAGKQGESGGGAGGIGDIGSLLSGITGSGGGSGQGGFDLSGIAGMFGGKG